MERKYPRCCACRTWKEAAILADKIKKAGGSDIDIKVRFKDNLEYGYRISWKDPENESSHSKIDLFLRMIN